MKKIIVATLLAFGMVASASALDLGIRINHQYGQQEGNTFGLTVGQKFGKIGVTGVFDRGNATTLSNQDRYAVEGSYDLVTFNKATVAATVGAGYLDNRTVESGNFATVGASVSYPVMKNVALVGGYRYQAGDSRVTSFNGNQVSFDVKYSF